MLPFAKTAKQRIMLASGVLAAAFVLAYYFGMFSGIWDNSSKPPDTEVARQDNKIKITANTDLIQKIVYSKCNDEEVFSTKPADNLIGLNLQQVQKVYSGWTIDRFDTQLAAMTLKVDSLCREHANNMFIGVKDGHVAVFWGKPGPKAIVKEVTQISVSRLSGDDLEELRRGMVVQNREELLRTLEGLQAQ